MLDGTGSGLCGGRTSQESFHRFQSSLSRRSFDLILKRSGTSHCTPKRRTFCGTPLSRTPGINRTGVRGGRRKATDDRGIVYACFWISSKSHSRCRRYQLIPNNEWTSAATAASKCRVASTDTAGKWMPFQPPWQEMHRKFFFFSSLPHHQIVW